MYVRAVPREPNNMKKCTACLNELPLTSYRKCGVHKNGTQKYRGSCKDCEKSVITDLIKEIHGDSCTKCGYNKCFKALDLHHLDSSQKDYQVSAMKGFPSTKVKTEIEKCVLLCANCHREIHASM